nr:MAG TPA: hypothetical protein [Caudoviricetes sp.]
MLCRLRIERRNVMQETCVEFVGGRTNAVMV